MSYTAEELEEMGITKLKAVAKELGIKGYSKYKSSNKDELELLILEALGEGPVERKKPPPKPRKKPRKSPRKAPSESAKEFAVGTERVGNDGEMYIVAERKDGALYWKKCSHKGAACVREPVEEEEVVVEYTLEEYNELVGKKVGELKKMAQKKHPEKFDRKLLKNQLVELLLTGKVVPRGPTPKRKKVTPKKKPRRKPTPPKKKPRKVPKEKEPVEEVEEVKLPKGVRLVGEVELDDWTAVGELEQIFEFLQQFEGIDELMDKIEVKNKNGIVRFEPDPTCDIATGLCGEEALGIVVKKGSYDLLEERTKPANYLRQVYVGSPLELEEADVRADFRLLRSLVVAKLDDLMSLVKGYDSAEALLKDKGEDFQDPTVAVFSNPIRAKRRNVMNVALLSDGKGVYGGLHIRRS